MSDEKDYLCAKTKQMTLEQIPNIKHTTSNNFFLLAGPCAIENEDMAMRIAEKVIVLLTDTELRIKMGENARKRIIDNFTIVDFIAKYEECYKELTSTRKSKKHNNITKTRKINYQWG